MLSWGRFVRRKTGGSSWTKGWELRFILAGCETGSITSKEPCWVTTSQWRFGVGRRGLIHLKSLTTERLRVSNRKFKLCTEGGAVAPISPHWSLFIQAVVWLFCKMCFVIKCYSFTGTTKNHVSIKNNATVLLFHNSWKRRVEEGNSLPGRVWYSPKEWP